MNRWLIQRRLLEEEGGGDGGAGGDGESGGKKETLLGSGGAGDDAGAGDQGNGEGAAGAGDGGDGDQGDGSSEWFLGDGIKGEGERPEWYKADKFKSVADQAAALPALEKKLGTATELVGAPEGDYALPDLPEGVEGEWDTDDPLLKGFMPLAKEMNLSQEAFERIVQWGSQTIAEQNAADDAALSEAISQLGPNANARIAAVDNYLLKEVGEEKYQALQQALGTNVAAYQVVEALVAKASGDAQLAGDGGDTGPGFDRADVDAERFKKYPEDHKLAGKVIYEHDAAHRKKVDEMYKKLFPGEDHQQVG